MLKATTTAYVLRSTLVDKLLQAIDPTGLNPTLRTTLEQVVESERLAVVDTTAKSVPKTPKLASSTSKGKKVNFTFYDDNGDGIMCTGKYKDNSSCKCAAKYLSPNGYVCGTHNRSTDKAKANTSLRPGRPESIETAITDDSEYAVDFNDN